LLHPPHRVAIPARRDRRTSSSVIPPDTERRNECTARKIDAGFWAEKEEDLD
jgi:hypothetical protein